MRRFFKRKKQNQNFRSYFIKQGLDLDFKDLSVDYVLQRWQLKGNAIIAGIGNISNENLLKVRLFHDQENFKLGQFILIINDHTLKETMLLQKIFLLLLEKELRDLVTRKNGDFYFGSMPISSFFVISSNNSYLIYLGFVLNILESLNLNYNEFAINVMHNFCSEINEAEIVL